MRDCTSKGDVVLDAFVGSGSTIMAAEKIGRRAHALDCEPRYVDVAIRRWETYTKSEAILEGDGRTFAEIGAERLALQEGAHPSSTAAVSNNDRTLAADPSTPAGDWTALCDEVAITILPKAIE
ncbi:MAG: DNA methyltransferase [Xanthobacteraceae bacterium]